jgi:hypothetical protein
MIPGIFSNPSVLYHFIDHEVERSLSILPPEIQLQLSETTKRYLSGQIPLQSAQDEFMRVSANPQLLNRVHQILTAGDAPLPPPPAPPAFSGRGSRRKTIPWSESEDLRLLVAVGRFGPKDWRKIAQFVGAGRTSAQCNQRWFRALDPAISHKPWTDVDDQQLLRAVEVLGKASWCQVAKILSGRTDLQCRYRYLQIVKVTEVSEKIEEPIPEPAAPVPIDFAKHRRNSISIALFTGELDLDNLKSIPSLPRLPYYLESSLTPRDDRNQQYLHRVPPILFTRPSKA